MINIDFKQYLPAAMRNSRWGEFIQAFQSIISDLKEEKIDILLKRFNVEEMSYGDFKNIINYFGFNLSEFEGYANSLEYIKRQAITLIYRIYYKTTRKAFLNEYYIFNMQGDVFPLYKLVSTELVPYTDWWAASENDTVIDILDSGDDNILYHIPYQFDNNAMFDSGQLFDSFLPFYDATVKSGLPDAYLDSPELVRTLDDESLLNYIVRQIILNYRFKKAETLTDFLLPNTAKAFSNDVKQLKRATELVYFEPIIDVEYTQNLGEVTTVEFPLFENSSNATQDTVIYQDAFDNISYIEFGTGRHTDLTVLSGVSSLSTTLQTSDINIEKDNNVITIRRKLFQATTFEDFSEIGVYTGGIGTSGSLTSGTLFLYSTFPAVRYNTKDYNNVQLVFTEV